MRHTINKVLVQTTIAWFLVSIKYSFSVKLKNSRTYLYLLDRINTSNASHIRDLSLSKKEKSLARLTVKQVLLAMTFVIFIIGLSLYHLYPTPIIKTYKYTNASLAYLEKKSIMIDGYTVHYYEGLASQEKDTLVLLHGLGDDKDSFVRVAKNLSDQYHILLPDLLGHGENEKLSDADYRIEGQVDMIRKFVKAKNIEMFHLGGHSMGGHIAAAYATKYQDTLKSLIIINSPGLKIDDDIAYNDFEDKTITEQDLEPLLAKIFFKIPKLPKPFRIFQINQLNENHDFTKYILLPQIMNSNDFDLINKISIIQVPTLILWGQHDEIVKHNIAEKFNELIPHSKLIYIDNASHCPQLEVPNIISADIDQFIKETKR